VSRGTVVLRVLGAAAAVLVAAWLAFGLRAAALEQRGNRDLRQAVSNPGDKAAAQRAASNFDRASRLNPDRLPRSYYAQLLVIQGQRDRGLALSDELTRTEPDNQEIWETSLAIALATKDAARQTRAVRRLKQLNPQGGIQ
jgi:predicted Zn-dependent protease